MSNNSCDTVFSINQILPNVLNAINGQEFNGIKIEQGTIVDILKKNVNIKDGLILMFSKNKIIDIVYKKNINLYLDNLQLILNDNAFFIILYDIENVENQVMALKMIQNYLNLILDNCD